MKKLYPTALIALFMTSFSVYGMETEENQRNTTTLHRAANLGSTRLVGFLLRHGADINSQNRRGETPLHIATKKGHIKTAKILLEAGARTNIADYTDAAPLHIATKNGNSAFVQLLAEHGADVNDRRVRYSSPLFLAIKYNNFDVVRILVRFGAHTVKSNTVDSWPLGTAVVCTQNPELVEFLIHNNANVNEPNRKGCTPLFEAMIHILKNRNVDTNFKIATLLIQNGADVNCRINGWTLLHIAAATGNYRCAELLIRHGADIHATITNTDNTPLHLAISPPPAQQNRNGAGLSYIEFRTARDIRSKRNLRVLNEYPKIIMLLLSVGAHYDARNLEEIRRLFPNINIRKALEIREARVRTLEAVRPDLPIDLSKLIFSFDHAGSPS